MALIHHVLAFHRPERMLFDRVLSVCASRPLACRIIALWIWLDAIGIQVIRLLKESSILLLILRYIREAEDILDVIHPNSSPPSGDRAALPPLTGAFVHGHMDLKFFYFNKEAVERGINFVLNGVGMLIFDDQLYHRFAVFESAWRLAEMWAAVPPAVPEDLGAEYLPPALAALEDLRSMFVTSDSGHALIEEELAEHLVGEWGNVIEKVTVENPEPGETPVYALVLFTTEEVMDVVMGGAQHMDIVIGAKKAMGRRYAPAINDFPVAIQ